MAYSIHISISQRQLTLYNGTTPLKVYPVGIGKHTTPTPPGRYFVANKRPNPGGPFGVYWMGLNIPHYGIHGTNNPASIGGFVSHGCIRLHNRDVLQLSSLVSVGTPVTITP